MLFRSDGLPARALRSLAERTSTTLGQLQAVTRIDRSTFARRVRSRAKLKTDESDRVVRFALLMGKAVEVMESEEKARQWLASPQFGLGGAVPLDYARTEVGAREVEDLLGRIEYGVYS